jgi:hypothetical protein
MRARTADRILETIDIPQYVLKYKADGPFDKDPEI